MEFVTAINFEHNDMTGVSHYLCDHFGFSMIGQDNSSVTVNNGVLSIRFCKSTDKNIRPIFLDMETTDMEAGAEDLKSKGFEPNGAVKQAELFRMEQQFSGPFQLMITLHKVLTEDDLGIQPELDITLDWEPEAVELAKTLLSHVTIHFRHPARIKMVKQAEALALIEGNIEVNVDDMVTAFLYTTPYFKQEVLQNLLLDHGISQEFITTQLEKM